MNDETYYETLEILRGNKKLPKIFIELKDWLHSEYQVEAYNFELNEIKIGKTRKRFRLDVLLSSNCDYLSMKGDRGFDAKKQDAIAHKLYNLAQKYSLKNIDTHKDVFVAFTDFSDEMKTDYVIRAFNLINEQLSNKYAIYSVWTLFRRFYTVVVFYNTEVNITTNQFIGISKQIKDDFYEVLYGIDEFNLFTYENLDFRYDSKENLDNHYEGNLFYYYKQ